MRKAVLRDRRDALSPPSEQNLAKSTIRNLIDSDRGSVKLPSQSSHSSTEQRMALRLRASGAIRNNFLSLTYGHWRGDTFQFSPRLCNRRWDLPSLLSTLPFNRITNRPDNGLKGCEPRFQRNWRYVYIISDIRGINLQVLMIPRPTLLWVFRMLPTEVLCDSILVIFNEFFNEHISLVLVKQSTSRGCSASHPSRIIIMRDKIVNFAHLN